MDPQTVHSLAPSGTDPERARRGTSRTTRVPGAPKVELIRLRQTSSTLEVERRCRESLVVVRQRVDLDGVERQAGAAEVDAERREVDAAAHGAAAAGLRHRA